MLFGSASPSSAEILVQKVILLKLNYVCHRGRGDAPKTALAGKQLLKLSLEKPYIFNFSSPNKLLILIEVSKYNEKVILKQFCT